MFDIVSIKLRDFKSYAGEHEFVFPVEPGLYFLTGVNLKEPKLEANAAGKSTLLDAIYWCLYGETLRGLKAGDVVNWDASSCEVSLEVVAGGSTLRITRTQNPNTLVVNNVTVDKDTLQKQLGLAPDAFTYSIIMPQFNKSFFELTPTNKLALFSQITNLDSWLGLSDEAAAIAKEIMAEINELSNKLKALTLTMESSVAELRTFKEREDQFASIRAEEVKRLLEQTKNIESDIKELTSGHDDALAILGDLQSVIGNKTNALTKVREAQDAYGERCNGLNKETAEAAAKVELLAKTVDGLKKVGSKCPTCLQKVTPTHMKEESERVWLRLEKARVVLKRTQDELDTADKFLRKSIKDRNDLLMDLENLRQEERKAERSLSSLDSRLFMLKAELSASKIAADAEKKRENPYTKLIQEKELSITDNRAEQSEVANEMRGLTEDHEAVSFWVAGFKRVRLFLIEETLRTFEVEVNNSLASLGLTGWQVNFDVQRENKSGGITKGFTVLIQAPGHAEPVKWEAWSGGETQRLQLAGDLGLANLIMHQSGLRSTIEFYDEPSKHLSKAGLLDLAETLNQRALDDGKRIFLVDHNMPEFGDFADVITIEKDEKGYSCISSQPK